MKNSKLRCKINNLAVILSVLCYVYYYSIEL